MRSILLVAAVVLAGGGVDPKRVQSAIDLIEAGMARVLVLDLDNGVARAAFAADPKSLRAICTRAAACAAALARSREDALRLGTLLEEVADAAVAADPRAADAHRARAESRLAAGRMAVLSGRRDEPQDRWIAAADSLEKAYRAEAGDGSALAAAAEALLEGAGRPKADAPALLVRAAALSGKALEKHPGSVAVLKAATLLDVEGAGGSSGRRTGPVPTPSSPRPSRGSLPSSGARTPTRTSRRPTTRRSVSSRDTGRTSRGPRGRSSRRPHASSRSSTPRSPWGGSGPGTPARRASSSPRPPTSRSAVSSSAPSRGPRSGGSPTAPGWAVTTSRG